MIRSKLAQRITGLIFLLAGSGFTVWLWNTLITEGYYYRKSAVIFPALAVIGIGMILFPFDVEEMKKQYGVEKPQSFRQLPLAWKLFFPVPIVAGFLNAYLMSRY